jgi:hypothetical protein
MPTLITLGAGSSRGFGLGTQLTSYWIATLGTSGGAESGQSISVDNLGNAYVAGFTASNHVLITKYNSSGIIQWQRTLTGSGSEYGFGIKVDASGNVYVCGSTSSAGAGSDDILIVKYTSSGSIQWQKVLGSAGIESGLAITVDSSGYIYLTGYTNSSGSNDILIVKYDSTGSIQWQRTLGGGGNDIGRGISVDTSGNVYVTGNSPVGAGGNDIIIAKYNTSGVIQWQTSLGRTSGDACRSVSIDGSGNIYVVGSTDPGSSSVTDIIISKYNTSGAIQWQRTLSSSSTDVGYGISVDSSGNSYITGTGGAAIDIIIAKYDSNGSIQWQRTLSTGSGNDAGNGISLSSSGDIYITGWANVFNQDILIAKLPGNGTKTGTYGSFTYAASSLTDAAGSLTSATSTLTDQASSLTAATSALTDAASTLTSTVTPI